MMKDNTQTLSKGTVMKTAICTYFVIFKKNSDLQTESRETEMKLGHFVCFRNCF
jgi:hypothetical protein